MFGGRTECFKRYVVSLYPTVSALDDYAVGFRRYVDVTVTDTLNDNFIGLIKCDVIPPDNLYIPVLPDK